MPQQPRFVAMQRVENHHNIMSQGFHVIARFGFGRLTESPARDGINVVLIGEFGGKIVEDMGRVAQADQ